MPNITGPAFSFPGKSFPSQQAGAPVGAMGELAFSEVLGKYSTLVKAGKVFYASAVITSPAAFVTAAQLGPILWNKGGSNIDAHILAVTCSEPSTATAVPGAIGLATNVQTTLPTSITAIVANNCYAGGGVSQLASVGTGGTVVILPLPTFLPLIGVAGAAITVGNTVTSTFADIGGLIVVAPGTVGYVAATVVLTAAVITLGIVWAELPV
jgi:hypothetical protein